VQERIGRTNGCGAPFTGFQNDLDVAAISNHVLLVTIWPSSVLQTTSEPSENPLAVRARTLTTDGWTRSTVSGIRSNAAA